MTLTASRLRTALVASSLLVAGGLLLAGCSSADASADSSKGGGSSSNAGQQQRQQQSPRGVSGLIASADDGLLQVQSTNEQTSVRYTDDTTITKRVAVGASSIAVGDCVMIMTDAGSDTKSATSVTVTEASDDGTCGMGGFPGGGAPSGERPEGMPTDMPKDRPTDMPTSGPGGRGGFGSMVSGAVTAVSSSKVTVDAVSFGEDQKTTSTEVALNADTTITGTADATTTDIKSGLCVMATGKADDAGGYDATALVLSDPDDSGQCTGGFPGGGRIPGGQAPDGNGGGQGGDSE
ncbi:hypothetical protein ACFVAE_03855 [Microbacterium sp. NPDC057659]|uniref:hypothetical protein n=1 Tax=Microbacterium sp. NPDC057659 TaxID=3346198 RepID=UPI003673048A